jgi:hypothetical protein
LPLTLFSILRWSTVIFDFTIQMMPDATFALWEERVRWKIHSLEEILCPIKAPEYDMDNDEDDEEEAMTSAESLVPPPTPAELAKAEKELRWFQSFQSKVREARQANGIPASVKWKRLKSDPLSNETSALNYLKSLEDDYL